MADQPAPDRYMTFAAATFSSGTAGRAFTQVRDNVFVVDDPARPPYDGPGSQPGAGELFVSGITTCAALMMERIARAEELPLQHVHVGIEARFDTQAEWEGRPPVLDSARMRFTFRGVDDEQGARLVEIFKRR